MLKQHASYILAEAKMIVNSVNGDTNDGYNSIHDALCSCLWCIMWLFQLFQYRWTLKSVVLSQNLLAVTFRHL